jgi:hypothetical protein
MRIPALIITLFVVTTGNAQYYDSSPSLVLGAEAAVPIGPLSQTHLAGIGFSGKIRLPAGELSDVLFTGNVAVFVGKTVGEKKQRASLAKTFTAFVGYRYYLNPLSDYNSFYIQGDVGLSAVTSKIINPAIAPSIGYLVNDRLDLALRYQTILTNNRYSKVSFVAFSVAYGLNFN